MPRRAPALPRMVGRTSRMLRRARPAAPGSAAPGRMHSDSAAGDDRDEVRRDRGSHVAWPDRMTSRSPRMPPRLRADCAPSTRSRCRLRVPEDRAALRSRIDDCRAQERVRSSIECGAGHWTTADAATCALSHGSWTTAERREACRWVGALANATSSHGLRSVQVRSGKPGHDYACLAATAYWSCRHGIVAGLPGSHGPSPHPEGCGLTKG